MDDYLQRRAVALAILTHADRLTRKAGSFCGQVVVDPTPLTEKQAEWLSTLADRAGIDTLETAR